MFIVAVVQYKVVRGGGGGGGSVGDEEALARVPCISGSVVKGQVRCPSTHPVGPVVLTQSAATTGSRTGVLAAWQSCSVTFPYWSGCIEERERRERERERERERAKKEKKKPR